MNSVFISCLVVFVDVGYGEKSYLNCKGRVNYLLFEVNLILYSLVTFGKRCILLT